jgi:hypothetical protein
MSARRRREKGIEANPHNPHQEATKKTGKIEALKA